jgi:hypothetical protein
MPMLIWLPTIFMSVLLEMNGFAPQGQANNDPLGSNGDRRFLMLVFGRFSRLINIRTP